MIFSKHVKLINGMPQRTRGAAVTFAAACFALAAPVSAQETNGFSEDGNTGEMRQLVQAICPDLAALSGGGGLSSDEEDLFQRCNSLLRQGGSNGFEQVAPEEFSAQGSSLTELNTQQFTNVYSRIQQIRSVTGIASAPGADTGRALAASGQIQSDAQPMSFLVAGAAAAAAQDDAFEDLGISRWGAFLNGSFFFGDYERSRLENGFEFDGFAITAGVDYAFNGGVWLGASFGYSQLSSDFTDLGADSASAGGEFNTDALTGTLYAYYQPARIEALSVYGMFQYSAADFETNRRINIFDLNLNGGSQLRRTANGETDGNTIAVSVGADYDFRIAKATYFGPSLRLDYVNADIDGYGETGAQGLNITFGDQEITSVKLAVGAHGSKVYASGYGPFAILVVHARGEWVREFSDDSRALRAQYTAQSGVSSTAGDFGTFITDEPDRSSFVVGFGVSGNVMDRFDVALDYGTVLGLDRLSSHAVSAEIRVPFNL